MFLKLIWVKYSWTVFSNDWGEIIWVGERNRYSRLWAASRISSRHWGTSFSFSHLLESFILQSGIDEDMSKEPHLHSCQIKLRRKQISLVTNKVIITSWIPSWQVYGLLSYWELSMSGPYKWTAQGHTLEKQWRRGMGSQSCLILPKPGLFHIHHASLLSCFYVMS